MSYRMLGWLAAVLGVTLIWLVQTDQGPVSQSDSAGTRGSFSASYQFKDRAAHLGDGRHEGKDASIVKTSMPTGKLEAGDGGSEEGYALKKSAPQITVRAKGADSIKDASQPQTALATTVGGSASEANRDQKIYDSESLDKAPLFTSDELAQLARSGAAIGGSGSGLIGGSLSRGEGIVGAPAAQVDVRKEAEPDGSSSSAADEQEGYDPPRYTGQARGYAMLYLMHPSARATVEAELQIMLGSGVREVFLGVLTDGTFGKNFGYLAQVLRRFNSSGRVVTLLLYLTNGPTQRRQGASSVTAGFNQIDPLEFRSLIQSDSDIKARFAEMAREVKPVFQLNAALNPFNRNLVSVMLEDNLQVDSYQAMRDLAHAELGDLVEYVRNPCASCYKGNDDDPLEDRLENHGPNAVYSLRLGDGMTLDGKGLVYEGDSGVVGVSAGEAAQLARLSRQRRLSYFGLWRTQRQGLYGGEILHPDERHYEVPSADQMSTEMAVLRAGLNGLEQDSEEKSGETMR